MGVFVNVFLISITIYSESIYFLLISFIMRRSLLAIIILPSFFFAACQTMSPSIPQEPKEGVEEVTSIFTGTKKNIDSTKSSITFIGKSDIVDHPGSFGTFTATMNLDTAQPAKFEKATVAISIDMQSIQTDSDGLRGHLLRADFFDAEQYPQALFSSTNIVRKDTGSYAITGNLTLKGKTATATFDALLNDEQLTAHYDLPREEFGIGNNRYGKKILAPLIPVEVKMVFQE